ncbi:MAG: c-type cytochrome [Planctomycetota bacterium]
MRALATLGLVPLGAALLLAGPDPNPEAVARGRRLYLDTQGLEYPSCAQCHSLLPAKDERKQAAHLGPGTTLFGAAVREGWRNMSTYADVGEASQRCAKYWQKRKGGLKPGQRADLVAFLKTQAPRGPLPRRKVERRPRLLESLAGGDAKRGARLVARYCTGCHNAADEALSFELKPRKKRKQLVARKVRGYDAKNKFKPQTGSMSYYTTDRLPDADLLDIIAYIGK